MRLTGDMKPPGRRELSASPPKLPVMDDSVKPGDGERREPPRRTSLPRTISSELRGLPLAAADEKEVVRLQQRLEDPADPRAEDVSRVLAEAVAIRSQEDRRADRRAHAVTGGRGHRPLRAQELEVLVDALFPVMGPAIRKAISSTFAEMLERSTRRSVSVSPPRDSRWRIEAWRTGKSFSEVVPLRTLVFRVEQVFLIHRKTGLLLQHVHAGERGSRTPT